MGSQSPCLAILHGGGQGSWVWAHTLAALRRQDEACFAKVLALDVPGCGAKRDRSTESLMPEDVVRELISDLQAAGMREIVLVGHSLAGNLLPAMAEARPDIFRRLVYLSCSIPMPGQTVLEMMGTGLHGADENAVGWPVDPATTSMEDRYAAMYCEDMSASQADAFLGELGRDEWPSAFFTNRRFSFDMSAAPATYVLCLRDRILPAEWQRTFAARFHAGRIVQLDAGHQAMVTRPHALAEILRHETTIGRACN